MAPRAAPAAAAVPSPPQPPQQNNSKRDYGTLPTTTTTQTAQLQQAKAATTGPKRRLVPGWAYLLLFVLLYSANNAVLAKFLARGPPYTICGIMCVGNFLGCLSLYPVFWRQITWRHIRKVTAAQWGWMLLGCLLANVLGSVAYLQGLKLTSVPARAMTGRLESVDFLLASAIFLGDTHGRWVTANALLTVAGVAAAVFYPLLAQQYRAEPPGLRVGYLYLVLGGWGYSLSLIITKRYLVHIPVGLLSLFKLALGTILFHALSSLQHPHDGNASSPNSMGLYSKDLWLSMAWYAPLFVTSTMVLWLRALKLCSPALLSVGMNCNFMVTVLFGILIVGKWPTPGETIGGGFILLSILSGVGETIINGDGEAREERRRLRRLRRKEKEAGWPVAVQGAGGEFGPPAASPVEAAAAAVLEAGGVGEEEEEEEETGSSEEDEDEEEDETARLIHKHKPRANHHLDFDSLVEGEGVGMHPFS